MTKRDELLEQAAGFILNRIESPDFHLLEPTGSKLALSYANACTDFALDHERAVKKQIAAELKFLLVNKRYFRESLWQLQEKLQGESNADTN